MLLVDCRVLITLAVIHTACLDQKLHNDHVFLHRFPKQMVDMHCVKVVRGRSSNAAREGGVDAAYKELHRQFAAEE